MLTSEVSGVTDTPSMEIPDQPPDGPRSIPLSSNRSYPLHLPESKRRLRLPRNKWSLADSVFQSTVLRAVANEITPDAKYDQLWQGVYNYFANTLGVLDK